MLAVFAGLAGRAADDRPPCAVELAKRYARTGSGTECLLQGVVSVPTGALSSPKHFYLQDSTGGALVRNQPELKLLAGDVVTTAGVMAHNPVTHEFRFSGDKVELVRRGTPLEPRQVTVARLLEGRYLDQLISVKGAVVRITLGDASHAFHIGQGEEIARVVIPAAAAGRSMRQLLPGTGVEATGICVPRTNRGQFQGYRLRLRSAEDLAVVQPVSLVKTNYLRWGALSRQVILPG